MLVFSAVLVSPSFLLSSMKRENVSLLSSLPFIHVLDSAASKTGSHVDTEKRRERERWREMRDFSRPSFAQRGMEDDEDDDEDSPPSLLPVQLHKAVITLLLKYS